MFKKDNIGYMVASVGFFLASIFEFIGSQLVMGFVFATFGFVFLTLYIGSRKPNVLDYKVVEEDELLHKYIKDNKKIEAIKRCRLLTNCGLKEANDYVEAMLQ